MWDIVWDVRAKRVALCMVLLLCGSTVAMADDLPRVQVDNVRRAFHNGEHNAFTDLCQFRDAIYLCFRSCPDGHMVHPTSSIIILRSDDGKEWRQVHRFHVDRRDVRDPHMLVFDNQLFVYTGTWYCGDTSPERWEINQHLGYAVTSRDGIEWSQPRMLEGTYGHYIWRAATDGTTAFLCGRRKHQFQESSTRMERDRLLEAAMLESDDGINFRPRGLFQDAFGGEVAFLIEPDQSILAVARSGGDRNSQICRSHPPYHTFEQVDLDRAVGGPLIARWGDHHLVGGRKSIGDAVMSLYWLVGDRLHEITELPSGGDCSYPGFVSLGDSRGLVSYYSTHERNEQGEPFTAIYLADLSLTPSNL